MPQSFRGRSFSEDPRPSSVIYRLRLNFDEDDQEDNKPVAEDKQ